jgi:type II secretory pathway pseudopilin PulG
MLTRGTRSRAFTLVELLVVVMIIFMLSGMLFTVSKLAGAKATRAQSIAVLERMRNALTEFHAEYGIYPPTSSVTYEREQSDLDHQPQALINFLEIHDEENNPNNFFPDTRGSYSSSTPDARYMPPDELTDRQANGTAPWPVDTVYRGEGLGYRYGLVSYLWPRGRGGQVHFYDADTGRDKHAKVGWSSYLEDVQPGGGSVKRSSSGLGTTLIYSNVVHVVYDGWGHVLKYSSPPPYSSFELWSVGPDGKTNTADDVGNDTFAQ